MKKTTIELNTMNYASVEELKTLRTNILFCGDDKQVIMVTSSVMGCLLYTSPSPRDA